MLILAGVSINLVIGNNGIISRAKDAKDATEQAAVNDQIAMNSLYDELAGYLDGSAGGNGGGSGGGSGTKPEKVAVGNKASKNSTINGEEATATNPIIPEGYIPINTDTTTWGDGSTAPTEENVNKGLVIKDESGNEWVWVPVPDASVMYSTEEAPIELTGGSGKTYLSGVNVSKYSKSEIISGQTRVLPNDTSSFREPDVVVGSNGTDYDAGETYRATAGFTKIVGETTTTMTLAEMAQIMVDEYETMIASIEKYHGFYIGRYELNVNGEEKTGTTLTGKNWYYLYAQCKAEKLTASDKVMSRMIWGCQWDVTCNWIANYGDQKDISDSSTWGNYKDTSVKASDGTTEIKASGTSQILDTGITTFTRANNVYDIAGNASEWSQEASYANSRVSRGGNYINSGSVVPASDRIIGLPDDSHSVLRFPSHFNSATLSN